DIAVVQDGRLPWRDSPLRFFKAQFKLGRVGRFQQACRIRLAITCLGRILTRVRRVSGDPAGVLSMQSRRFKPRMVMTLNRIQRIGVKVLARGIPGISRTVVALLPFYATDAKALTLAQ